MQDGLDPSMEMQWRTLSLESLTGLSFSRSLLLELLFIDLQFNK